MQKKKPEQVKVYAATRPNRPVTEVGYIVVSKEGTSESGKIIERLRLAAAQAGCDALLGLAGSDKVSGSMAFGIGVVDTTKGLSSVCVIFADAAARQAYVKNAPHGQFSEVTLSGPDSDELVLSDPGCGDGQPEADRIAGTIGPSIALIGFKAVTVVNCRGESFHATISE